MNFVLTTSCPPHTHIPLLTQTHTSYSFPRYKFPILYVQFISAAPKIFTAQASFRTVVSALLLTSFNWISLVITSNYIDSKFSSLIFPIHLPLSLSKGLVPPPILWPNFFLYREYVPHPTHLWLFNLHNYAWFLRSSSSNAVRTGIKRFAILNPLHQLILSPTEIPDISSIFNLIFMLNLISKTIVDDMRKMMRCEIEPDTTRLQNKLMNLLTKYV